MSRNDSPSISAPASAARYPYWAISAAVSPAIGSLRVRVASCGSRLPVDVEVPERAHGAGRAVPMPEGDCGPPVTRVGTKHDRCHQSVTQSCSISRGQFTSEGLVNDLLRALETQRWDDHRYYHHSRINQSLHLVSAMSFLCAYVLLFTDPV